MTGSRRKEFVGGGGPKGLLVGDVDAGGEVDVGWFCRHVARWDGFADMKSLFPFGCPECLQCCWADFVVV